LKQGPDRAQAPITCTPFPILATTLQENVAMSLRENLKAKIIEGG
jgi:hypothetical protein